MIIDDNSINRLNLIKGSRDFAAHLLNRIQKLDSSVFPLNADDAKYFIENELERFSKQSRN